jgi:hypothetical protein
MADEKQPDPGAIARAKRIHEQIDRLSRKGSEGEAAPADSDQPRSLRDIIHDRMEKLDKKKEG